MRSKNSQIVKEENNVKAKCFGHLGAKTLFIFSEYLL